MLNGLTCKEQEVLELLMKSEVSLTATEIVAQNSELNSNTVQAVLRKLLKRGFIEVNNIVYSGTVLCRSYQPTAQARAAELQEFTSHFQNLRRSMPVPQIFAGLIDANDSDEQAIIDELEAMIAQKRAAYAKEATEEEA
ncbi:MAG: BlaI/MecI/CopY family transcriptional regulator [Clostridia bacterium]